MKPRQASKAFFVAVLLTMLITSAANAETTYSCPGEFAPVVTSCTTGWHTRTADISHDVTADVNYVGTLESTLVWSGGERVFRCTYVPEAQRECIAYGSFPPINTAFQHNCRSIIPGTADPGTPADGVEGGVGTWSCSVYV
ncbi:MAG: hypothetical protein ACYDCC_09780 [Actinomycetota bacterium]